VTSASLVLHRGGSSRSPASESSPTSNHVEAGSSSRREQTGLGVPC
jgi:hypothetical protein